jgi:hypothetical protein
MSASLWPRRSHCRDIKQRTKWRNGSCGFSLKTQQSRAIEDDKERAEFVDEGRGDGQDKSYAGQNDGEGDEKKTAQHVLINDPKGLV